MTNLKFYKRKTAPESPVAGDIWFDSTKGIIKVYTGTAWESYDGPADVTFDTTNNQKILKITSKEGTSATIDLSDCASAKAVAEALTAHTEAFNTLKGGSDKTIKGLSDDISTLETNYKAADTALEDSLKAEIKNAISSTYKVKGSVQNMTELQAIANPENGDVYNVIAALDADHVGGMNYVYVSGTDTNPGTWDELGGTIDLSNYVDSINQGDAVEKQFVTALTKSNGEVTVTRRALTADDIPALAISKITDLQSALDAKALKTTTVNDKELSGDITLTAADVKLESFTEAATYSAPEANDTIKTAIEKLTKGVSEAQAAGVTSIGGQSGTITLAAAKDDNGSVNLSMTDEKVLSASIKGLDSAAYTKVEDYDAAGTAETKANAVLGSDTDTADAKTVYGAIALANSKLGADAVDTKISTAIGGLDATVENTADNAGATASSQIKVTVTETDGKLASVSVLAPSFASTEQGTKADSALQSVSASGSNYITASFADKADNAQALTVSSTIQTVADASDTAKGLAEASDVKNYVDNITTLNWASFE